MAYRSTTAPAVPAGHVRCETHGIQPIRTAHDGTKWCRPCRQAAIRVTCSRCGKTVIGACTECPGRINLVPTPGRIGRAIGVAKGALTWAFIGTWFAAFAAVVVMAYVMVKLPFLLMAREVYAMGHPVHAYLIGGGMITFVAVVLGIALAFYYGTAWLVKR